MTSLTQQNATVVRIKCIDVSDKSGKGSREKDRYYDHVLSQTETPIEEISRCQRCGQTMTLAFTSENLSIGKRFFIILAIIIGISSWLIWPYILAVGSDLKLVITIGYILAIIAGYFYLSDRGFIQAIFWGHRLIRVEIREENHGQNYQHGYDIDIDEKQVSPRRQGYARHLKSLPISQLTLGIKCFQRSEFRGSGLAEVIWKTGSLNFQTGGILATRIEKRTCPICGKNLEFEVNNKVAMCAYDTSFINVGMAVYSHQIYDQKSGQVYKQERM